MAPDLPGHGFTDPMKPGTLSLPGMARALGALVRQLGPSPEVVVGHSAGAAILAKLCIDGTIAPRLLISLNGAWLPFEGVAGQIFPPMAKLLFLNPLAPRLFAWSADRHATSRLLRGTGSTIDARGVDLYQRLFSNPAHVAGALGMMANWDLDGAEARMAAPDDEGRARRRRRRQGGAAEDRRYRRRGAAERDGLSSQGPRPSRA